MPALALGLHCGSPRSDSNLILSMSLNVILARVPARDNRDAWAEVVGRLLRDPWRASRPPEWEGLSTTAEVVHERRRDRRAQLVRQSNQDGAQDHSGP